MSRKQRPNREVFRCNKGRIRLQQGQRGECCNFQPGFVAKLYSPISLILERLFPYHRTTPSRTGKIGEDGSGPSLNGVSCGPNRGAMLHASIVPLGGRSRPKYPCGKARKRPQRRC